MSLPSTGHYDPRRFPEEPIPSCPPDTEQAVTFLVPRPDGALVLRLERAPEAVIERFRLALLASDVPLLEIEVAPYRHAGLLHSATRVRHRLTSVKSLARIGGYRFTPAMFAADEHVFEARPAIPATAEWL